jgi:4-hydroxy-tetrahydrodipicolinate synthase
MKRINGVVPVLATPLTQNGEIDVEGLIRLCNYLTSFPIGGLWVLGTGSEDMNLTFQKRLLIAKVVTETVAERVPVVLGAGFFCLEDSLAFIDATTGFNFSSYHVMPYHPLLSSARLEAYYLRLAGACPKPLWLYTSGNWSQQLPFDTIFRLKKHGNIVGIKYSTTNTVNVAKVATMVDDEFQLITAVAGQMYSCLCLGSTAHTSSLASAVPELLVDVWMLYKEGHHDKALEAQRKTNSFLETISKAKKDNFIWAAEEKYILSLKGICQEWVTDYYRTLTDTEKDDIRKSLEIFKVANVSKK